MQMLGNIFTAVVFVSVVGSVFCVLSLFAAYILRCIPPLWFSLCGMLLFCLPVLSPDVILIPPEEQEWLEWFSAACRIWVCGCGVLFLFYAVRSVLAGRALRRYPLCGDERINAVCTRCAEAAGLGKKPTLYWGTLDTPICVAGIVRPAVIMNEEIAVQLTDAELTAVFFHELSHMKRRHVLLERIYDYVCLLNWFNPFVWIARGNFSLHCELDCDSSALKFSQGRVTKAEYASAILRLLELSAAQAAKAGKGVKTGKGVGALRFLWTKQRMKRIVEKGSRIRDGMAAAVLTVFLLCTIAFSLQFSREHFYPYPAYDTGTEYSVRQSMEYSMKHNTEYGTGYRE